MLGPSSPKQSQAQPNPLKPKNLTKLKTNQPKFTNLIHQKKERKKERKRQTRGERETHQKKLSYVIC